MNYGIIVTNHAEASKTAINFINAAALAGHSTYRVFFYGNGVFNASIDRPSATQVNWQELSKTLQIELVICVTAAIKRNLIPAKSPKSQTLIAEHFTVSGLGQLAELAMHCDRVITFR